MVMELDARGLLCPLPVLKARKAMKTIGLGDRLVVLTTDPGAPKDFEHLCTTTGSELVRLDQFADHARIEVIRRT